MMAANLRNFSFILVLLEKGRFQKLLFSVKNVLKRYAFSDRFRWIRVDRKLLPKNEIKKGVIEKKSVI